MVLTHDNAFIVPHLKEFGRGILNYPLSVFRPYGSNNFEEGDQDSNFSARKAKRVLGSPCGDSSMGLVPHLDKRDGTPRAAHMHFYRCKGQQVLKVQFRSWQCRSQVILAFRSDRNSWKTDMTCKVTRGRLSGNLGIT